ncbi:protein phosphatase 2C domain-containing protein [Kitasatospora sp. NPDC090308]|uniref:protein phosphatase 2C domain-containing protein n=1 Tax=Kitasatospora sp. NPDC090308 TaxID=3364082 RepID=UPI0037F7FCDB
MQVVSESRAGESGRANEDWLSVGQDLIVVLDGATARTDTGCTHGVSWYAAHLGSAIREFSAIRDLSLETVLRQSIQRVAGLHAECDLAHPGSPSAAVGIVRLGENLEYLVLGDISLAIATGEGISVVTDPRVSATARAAREEADQYLIGTPEKQEALLRMKAGELAAKNREGGYWIATSEPSGVEHALTGTVPLGDVSDLVVLTDGSARIVDLFAVTGWAGVFEVLRSGRGPAALIEWARELEDSDPIGERWPRNKKSDDASVVYAILST